MGYIPAKRNVRHIISRKCCNLIGRNSLNMLECYKMLLIIKNLDTVCSYI